MEAHEEEFSTLYILIKGEAMFTYVWREKKVISWWSTNRNTEFKMMFKDNILKHFIFWSAFTNIINKFSNNIKGGAKQPFLSLLDMKIKEHRDHRICSVTNVASDRQQNATHVCYPLITCTPLYHTISQMHVSSFPFQVIF